jgi:hypothetical protein
MKCLHEIGLDILIYKLWLLVALVVDSPGLRFAGPPSLPQAVKRVFQRPNPLSANGEERVDECNEVGVSYSELYKFTT